MGDTNKKFKHFNILNLEFNFYKNFYKNSKNAFKGFEE